MNMEQSIVNIEQDITGKAGKNSLILIINPVAGKKQALKFLPDIISTFTESGYVVSTYVTQKRGDAMRFARDHGDGFDLIVCSGGDGTFNETISGMAAAGLNKPLGYIPAGSTNDFAVCNNIPSDVLSAAKNAVCGGVKQLDIGRFNGNQYFSYVAAFGAFSWLSYTTSQNMKNVLGHSAYILDGIKDLSKLQSEYMTVIAGGREYEGDYIFGAVCNSTSVAGTITLPESVVKTDDGVFEVLLIHKPKTLQELQSVLMNLKNQDYSSPLIEFFQADVITAEAIRNVIWTLDGERGKTARSFRIENIPRFLMLAHG